MREKYQYLLEMTSQSYAPFGSVANRNRKRKASQQPGPGAYEISLPLISPIVETIRKNNNNVIIKLNHVGTAAFHIADPKPKNIEPSIGPGQYFQQPDRPKQNANYKWNRAHDILRELVKNRAKNRATIEEIRSIQIEDYVDMPEMQKQESKKKKDRIKGAEWAKMAGRATQKIGSACSLGPGEYNLPIQNVENTPSAAFKSESVRSYFDRIYFDTNRKEIARSRQQMHYKHDSLGPASYQISLSQHPKFYKYQFFNSTQDRN